MRTKKIKKLTKLQFALAQLAEKQTLICQANDNFYRAQQVNDDNVRKFKTADDRSATVIRELSDKLLVAKKQLEQIVRAL